MPTCNASWHNHLPSCKQSLPSIPIPLWDSASTWVAPGSLGRHIITPRSSTVCAFMDHTTGATVGNQNSPAPTLFLVLVGCATSYCGTQDAQIDQTSHRPNPG